ncbi:MAG: hypothetical protein NT069_07555 [Planctomycetota bacterium]|nr:hypothetical protein [Planctomycetota bacterium]
MNRQRWLLVLFTGCVVGVIVAADIGWASTILRFVHSIPLGDKVCHAVFMGGICWLANRAFSSRGLVPGFKFPTRVTGIVTALVLLEELSQKWIPGRTFSYGDIAADLLGIATAVIAEWLWPKRYRA